MSDAEAMIDMQNTIGPIKTQQGLQAAGNNNATTMVLDGLKLAQQTLLDKHVAELECPLATTDWQQHPIQLSRNNTFRTTWAFCHSLRMTSTRCRAYGTSPSPGSACASRHRRNMRTRYSAFAGNPFISPSLFVNGCSSWLGAA